MRWRFSVTGVAWIRGQRTWQGLNERSIQLLSGNTGQAKPVPRGCWQHLPGGATIRIWQTPERPFGIQAPRCAD